MEDQHINLPNGKGYIPFPGAKHKEWRVKSRTQDPENKDLILLVIENKETRVQQRRRVIKPPGLNLGFRMRDEEVLVTATKSKEHLAECDLGFGEIELVEPESESEPEPEIEEPPEPEPEEPEPAPEPEPKPEPEPEEPEPATDEVVEEIAPEPEEEPEPLEVFTAPLTRVRPPTTPGPVTSLPTNEPPGLPPAKKKRADRVARWKAWREAREERRRERPVRTGPSPATLALILVIAVGITIIVAGTLGAIAFFANNDSGHHEVTSVEDSAPEDPDPPVSTPDDTEDLPTNDPPAEEPEEQEPAEEPEETEPTNTPVEVDPQHIEIILPDGNNWSVEVNTGEEYMQEYTFECSEPDVVLEIGNGQPVWADDEQPAVHGPFRFKGPEDTSDIKCSIKW